MPRLNRATYSHTWTTHLEPHTAWQYLIDALENSPGSAFWPNEMSQIRCEEVPLKKGAKLRVVYKLGPLHSQAEYLVAELLPPHLLRYETSKRHLLKGSSTITISPSPLGGSHFYWRGEYRTKSLLSWPALLWFKVVFEKRFFKKLISRMETITEETPARRKLDQAA